MGPDGCIGLGSLGRLRVEGRTAPEIAQLLATGLGVPPDAVRVRVAGYRSQHLFLIGQVVGWTLINGQANLPAPAATSAPGH